MPTLALSLLPMAVGVGLAALMQFVIVPKLGAFHNKIITDIGINIILAVSLNLVNGFTGQFSIGHAGFMAVGGYVAGAITYYGSFRLWGSADPHGGFAGAGEWLFVSSCLVGGVVAALAGYIVGLPSLRLRGDYLAIVTLGFGEIVRVLLIQTQDVIEDADGLVGVPFYKQLLHLGGALGFSGLPFYVNPQSSGLFWVGVFVAVMLLVAYRLKESSYGRAFLAIRENEIAAEAMGVPVTRFKIRAFVLAAFFAGIAGGLFAHEVGTSLNANELGFQKSFDIIIMVVLGGMGSISGAVLAAVVLTILPEMLRDPPHAWYAAGLMLVLIIAFAGHARVRGMIWLVAVTAFYETGLALAKKYHQNPADYRMVIYALALIVMMIVRPQGIFGLRELWELGRRHRPAKAQATLA